MNKGKDPNNYWYVIYTRSRFEKKVYADLRKLGFHAFLPLKKETRKWSDRTKVIEAPLLPSYVFVYTTPCKFKDIYLIRGFTKFISFEGKPSRIKEEEIQLIQNIITHELPVKVSEYKLGDYVEVQKGPLAGWRGRVKFTKGKSNVIFDLDSLDYALSVEIEAVNLVLT